MKHARPLLSRHELHLPDALLTTADVAALLRVHPKHIYRLLRRGLPARRVGGEWRFVAQDVLRWAGGPMLDERSTRGADESPAATEAGATPATLVAANGDLVVEALLARLASLGPPVGHVQSDRSKGLELLRRGDVLAAGCHGDEIPVTLDGQRLAFIHLVGRQVGLALRRGLRWRGLRHVARWKLASRPPTAGVRAQFDRALLTHGIDPQATHDGAFVLPSHREVVCALSRGDADVGLASVAWASRVGLRCAPLWREPYGLLVRASQLGDPRVVRLCEVAQSALFRRELETLAGYDAALTGRISYEPQDGPAS
jgi:excisionase family DNA binding protein